MYVSISHDGTGATAIKGLLVHKLYLKLFFRGPDHPFFESVLGLNILHVKVL